MKYRIVEVKSIHEEPFFYIQKLKQFLFFKWWSNVSDINFDIEHEPFFETIYFNSFEEAETFCEKLQSNDGKMAKEYIHYIKQIK